MTPPGNVSSYLQRIGRGISASSIASGSAMAMGQVLRRSPVSVARKSAQPG